MKNLSHDQFSSIVASNLCREPGSLCYPASAEGPLEFHKPAVQPCISLSLRPTGTLTGPLFLGLTIKAGAAVERPVAVEWLGARGLISFLEIRSHTRALRLPSRVAPEDLYVLKVRSDQALGIDLSLPDGADFQVDQVVDGSGLASVCADPRSHENSPQAEDTLVVGYLSVAAKAKGPLFQIRALRPLPEGAVLRLRVRRERKALAANDLLFLVTVGNHRKLVIIPKGRQETDANFRLNPQTGEEIFPVFLETNSAFEWSGIVSRGFDLLAIPGFSLEEIYPS